MYNITSVGGIDLVRIFWIRIQSHTTTHLVAVVLVVVRRLSSKRLTVP